MTDIKLFEQALDVIKTIRAEPPSKDEIQRAWIVIELLQRRLAQPQQTHEINADTDAIGMAIQDTFVCGTGVVKLWFDGGKMSFDHVPIKEFDVFGDELKWRAEHTIKEKAND